MSSQNAISVKEIAEHNAPDDVWIVVNGGVWDITDFAPKHPGGAGIIFKYAGRDATKAYTEIHAPSILPDNLPAENYKGVVDESTITPEWIKPPPSITKDLALVGEKPPLSTLINTYDFEDVASKTLSKKTWAFYSSGATDSITRDANKSSFDKVGFRPRILRNVRDVSTKSRILGFDVQMPLFVSPAAMAKLVHPEGELALARGCASQGVIQCVSTNASYPLSEIVPEAPNHPFFFQLYVNKDRSKSEALLKQVKAFGIKAVFVTVDAPVPGKREEDERVKADENIASPLSGAKATNDDKGGGLGRIMGSYIDASLNWGDLPWLREVSDLPIVLKGVQGAEDARRAMEYGVKGLVLSNHGGRSLDTSPPAILLLLELQCCCPEVFEHMEIYIDGGIRRGTDILKALCLGATAVGIGRSPLYALNYGQEGVEHLIEILRDELETSMKLLGITDLSQVHPGLINSLAVDHLVPTTINHPYARWSPSRRRPRAKL
ncbi:MAG: Cytochrome b5 domain-containing protein 1 [Pycnora praestabilis]|nr:MAG: Cytochrome b5 domain-containing protein 1 [Pycnora praestabilis]